MNSVSGMARSVIHVLGCVALVLGAAACEGPAGTDDVSSPPGDTAARTLRVPPDHPTIQAAVDAARPGDLVLVEPGRYPEEVLVSTPDVTVRGTVRDDVVIDGEGVRGSGVVAVADGVRIENLTVSSTTLYGVLVTGLHDENGPQAHGVDGYETLDPEKFPPVQRFAVRHVTATNNGLYGIYAFDAQHGVIEHSYASGSADSGIYVGQCRKCDIVVAENVAERNAVGFENANASDFVVVANRFSGNRVGMTLLSNYQEAFTPQRANVVAGNVVTNNTSADSPAHAEGGFGIGIGISGGQDNEFRSNLVAGNPRAGVLLANTEDLPARGNVLTGTQFTADGLEPNGFDVANVSADRTPAQGNCVESGSPPSTLPDGLLAACHESQPSTAPDHLPSPRVPPGISFLQVPPPPPQPSLDDVGIVPGPLPDTVPVPPLRAQSAPAPGRLAELSGTAEGGDG